MSALTELRLRVARRFANECATVTGGGRAKDWPACVTYGEWFALDDALTDAAVRALTIEEALRAVADCPEPTTTFGRTPGSLARAALAALTDDGEPVVSPLVRELPSKLWADALLMAEAGVTSGKEFG